jgi:hypothetical protein
VASIPATVLALNILLRIFKCRCGQRGECG